MKNFFVIPNYSKEKTVPFAKYIQDFLAKRNANCWISPKATEKNTHYLYTDEALIPPETDCIIILGGDGTIIQAVHDVKARNIPIIGVNLGSIGYLAEVDKENLEVTLDRLLKDDYLLEERMTLEGEIIRNGKCIHRDSVLNDIILSRSNAMKMTYFNLYVNGEFLSHYAADGMIVATPTGSTAYSISAGGPIVMPGSFVMILTPICPHTLLNARSIILPRESVVELEVRAKEGENSISQSVNFDARRAIELYPGDRIRIICGKESVKMLRLAKTGFIETLRKKLN